MPTGKANHAHIPAGKPEVAPRRARARKLEKAHESFVHHCPSPGRAASLQVHSAPLPIWFAALIASNCSASGEDGAHSIHWICESGRAVYRNIGLHTEWVESLGVRLNCGDTLSVAWIPGDTSYTINVVHTFNHVA